MAEELKDLIEKINEEGIKAAEDKARAIEEEAKRSARAIIAKAEREAEALRIEAKERIAKAEESMRSSLKQAARDTILSLKKEINAMLDGLIASHIHKALTAEETGRLILSIIKEITAGQKDRMIISLKKEEAEKIEKAVLGELREEVKKGVVLRPSDDIRAGFRISYDSGKSYYDFTDKALAEYIAAYIRPKLAEILNESINKTA